MVTKLEGEAQPTQALLEAFHALCDFAVHCTHTYVRTYGHTTNDTPETKLGILYQECLKDNVPLKPLV